MSLASNYYGNIVTTVRGYDHAFPNKTPPLEILSSVPFSRRGEALVLLARRF